VAPALGTVHWWPAPVNVGGLLVIKLEVGTSPGWGSNRIGILFILKFGPLLQEGHLLFPKSNKSKTGMTVAATCHGAIGNMAS
jgi:hypothetical protein